LFEFEAHCRRAAIESRTMGEHPGGGAQPNRNTEKVIIERSVAEERPTLNADPSHTMQPEDFAAMLGTSLRCST